MPKWRTPEGPQLRYCAKVALAAVAAYALTLGGRNDYALYSVLGAALVMGGSVGEDLNASFNRVRGTVAGAIVGGALAYAFGKSIWALGVGVAFIAWLSVGLGWGTAALRVGIAMTLVVLFSQVDDAAKDAGWRVLNTLIGVAIGVAVSRLVWPVRGRDEVAHAIDRALAATSSALGALARGTSTDALLPFQRDVLDALAALRIVRTNAQRAQQLDRETDLLSAQTVLVVRAAIDTLGTSLRLDELVRAGGRAECLQAVRNVIAPLAAHASNARTGELPAADFATLQESVLREAAHPDTDANARALVTAMLSQLQQIYTALHCMRAP